MKRLAITVSLLFLCINAWSFTLRTLEADKNKRMVQTELNAAFSASEIISRKVETYNQQTKKAPEKDQFEAEFQNNSILSKATNGPMGDVIVKFSKNANPALQKKTIRIIPKEEKIINEEGEEEIIYDFDKTITLTNMTLKISGVAFKKDLPDYTVSPQLLASNYKLGYVAQGPEKLINNTYKEAQKEIKSAQKKQQQAIKKQASSQSNNNGSNGSDNNKDTSTNISVGKAPE